MTDLVSAEARLSSNVRQDWGTGAVVDIVLEAVQPISGWQVEVETGGTISDLWNAVVVSRQGTRYVVAAEDYNAEIAAGTSISFGMTVDGEGDFALVSAEVQLAEAAPADANAAAPSLPPVPAPGDNGGTAAQDGDGETAAAPTVPPLVSSPTVVEPQGPRPDFATVPPGPFAVDGTRIVDAGGAPVDLYGVNWFGLETDISVPHGLWARNWRTIMDDARDLGFNAMRLPFSGELAATGGTVSGVDFGLNPDLLGRDGLQILDMIVDYADTIGLRVLLDYHRGNPGGGPNDNGLWFGNGRTEANVIAEWTAMAERYADHPAVIGADLINEPHQGTWGDGGETDWAAAAERIGSAVLAVAPDWLVVVEGTSVYDGDSYWWGGNLQGVRDRPLQLPADRLVYSIHDYPPSVHPQPWFTDGTDIRSVWDKNWGFIIKDGIAPVLIGEWGSFLSTPADRQWADQLSAYIDELDVPWMWWSLNPNSGDTGGVFADDWTTVRPEVANLLDPFLVQTRPAQPLTAAAWPVHADFVVSLAAPAADDVLIKYATTDGTAKAGEDYVPVAGSLIFTAGEMEKTVSVPLLPDAQSEGDEFFYLVLGAGGGARASGTAIITEEERGRRVPTPFIDVANAVYAEGAASADFRLVLSAPSDNDITVDFRLEGADGSVDTGSATIPAGEREAALRLPIAPNQPRFDLQLTGADGAFVREGEASATLAQKGPIGSASATAATQLTIELILEDDWGDGALFNIILKNASPSPVNGWTLAMDLPFDIQEIWNAGLVSDIGERITVENVEWNGSIAPGEAIDFGFIVDAGNIILNQILAGADIEIVVQ